MASYSERSERNERGERTLPEVLQGIVGNVQEIIRSEVRLAKTEVKEEVEKAKQPAGLIGAGLFLSLYAVGFILLAIVYGLAFVMAAWMAALIVGLALAVFAAIFISAGKKKMKQVNAVPQRTAESLKENMEWAKRQIR